MEEQIEEGAAVSNILENINEANDIKKVNAEKYPILAQEIREFLISNISKTGGQIGRAHV